VRQVFATLPGSLQRNVRDICREQSLRTRGELHGEMPLGAREFEGVPEAGSRENAERLLVFSLLVRRGVVPGIWVFREEFLEVRLAGIRNRNDRSGGGHGREPASRRWRRTPENFR
jgi:hypothetical protein